MVGVVDTGHDHGKSVHGHGKGSQWSAAVVGVVGGASGCSPPLVGLYCTLMLPDLRDPAKLALCYFSLSPLCYACALCTAVLIILAL